MHLGAIRTSDPTAATEKFRDLAQKLKDAEAKLDKVTKELEISSELSEFGSVLELPKVAPFCRHPQVSKTVCEG